MRVVYLTAGAGGMYCGSCLRDNTLARHLTRLGLDLQLVPLYTPIRTDEADASRPLVFFGGINIYLRQKWRVFRILPAWSTRWLDAPWLLRRVASRQVGTDAGRLGELTLAMLAGDRGPLGGEVERLAAWLAGERPDVVNLSNLLIAGSLPRLKACLDAPLSVTLQGDDLFVDQLPQGYRRQALSRLRELAGHVDRFIVYSRFYQQKMAEMLEVEPERFEVVPLGIETADLLELNAAPRPDRPPTIGFLARGAPEKGLHILIGALIRLRDRPEFQDVRLIVAGWNTLPPNPYILEQQRRLAEADAAHSVTWLGEVDRAGKREFFESIDMLCVPQPYDEPKGMFALESLAAGVPVVVTARGALPETLAGSPGAYLVSEASPESTALELASRLGRLERLRLEGAEGRQWLLRERSAEVMARATRDVYHRLLSEGSTFHPEEG